MFRVIRNKFIRNRTVLVFLAIAVSMILFIQSQQLTSQLKLTSKTQVQHFVITNRTIQNRTTQILNVSNSNHDRQMNKLSAITVLPNSAKTTKVKLNITELSKLKYRMGHVNVHLWYKMCTTNIDSLRQMPLFPLWPHIRGQPKMPNELVSIMSSTYSAQRVMGRLYPPETGEYSFEITSGTVSELWLSTDDDPKNTVFLANNNKNRLHGVNFAKGSFVPSSKPVLLHNNRSYFFDIFHGMNDVSWGQVQVRWKLPSSNAYTAIPCTAYSTALLKDTSLDLNTRDFVTRSQSLKFQDLTLRKHTPHKWTNVNFSATFSSYPLYTRDNIHSLKFGDRAKVMSSFEECEYDPSYTKKRDFKRYQGVYWTHFNDVFPNDHTHDKVWQGFHEQPDRTGNTLMSEGDAVKVTSLFMDQLEAKFPGEYKLANVISIERNVDEIRGNRYLLEIVLEETKTKELQRFSEYLYQFKNQSDVLYKPKGLVWSPNTKIYTVITTKGQGPWVVHYIRNMAQAIHAYNDDNVHFLVVDYGNNGIDVEYEFKRNGLKHYTVIKKTGKFHKTLAIHDAVSTIKDGNSIVFLTDLHLDAPKNLFESVRKHTIQGRMTFTPVVFRLKQCGRPESDKATTTGYWDSYAFGIYSTFKSDWKYFGGLNVEEFKGKWGGEDWEMVDRVLAKGLEIDRIRLPFFYHYFHDKVGMWEQA